MKTILISLFIFTTLVSAQGPKYPYHTDLNFIASKGATGYNAYRAPMYVNPESMDCGTYVKLNATPFPSPSYSDANPPQGAYCYVVTALNGVKESAFSAPYAGIQIPPPPPTQLNAVVGKGVATFGWIQSNGTDIAFNTIYTGNKSGGPYNLRYVSKTPMSTVQLPMSEGEHYVVVTTTDTFGRLSGASNEVNVNVAK